MKTETTPVPVHTPLGTLYVAIRRAREDSWHETGKGNVTALRPRLFVSTAPEFEAEPSASEHWTIRGRRYGVQCVFYFHDTPRFAHGDTWHKDNQAWSGDGYRDDHNGPIKFQSATWGAIDAAVRTGLDAFTAMHPRWAQLSEYLTHDSDAKSAASEAEQLRREATQHAARSAALDIAALAAIEGAPAELRALAI